MLSRKEFLIGIAGTAATLVVAACGGDDSSGSPGGEGDGNCADDLDVTISSNHGHALSVPAGDFDGAASKTYSIKGSSEHDHAVTLSAQDFADLKAGKKVATTSTTGGGHSHPLQIIC